MAAASLAPAERVLLELVEKVTLQAHRTSAEDMERIRAAGWSDEQIAETVYITGIFAMFNRVADAFGLEDPGYRQWLSEGNSPPRPAERGRPGS